MSNFPTLERSSVEAYASTAVGIIIAVVPMSWELKAGCFVVIGFLFTDICLRSHWTHQWGARSRLALVLISWILVAAIAWKPVGNQYTEDNKPTEANFSLSIDSIDIFDKRSISGDVIYFYFWVTLKNSGAPSMAGDWSLVVDVPNRGHLNAQYLHLGTNDKWRVTPDVELTGADEEDQSENKEIHGAIYPRLLFAVSGIPYREAIAAKTTFTLMVRDRDGNIYQTRRAIGDLPMMQTTLPDAANIPSTAETPDDGQRQ